MAALNKPRGVNASIQCYHGQLDEIYYFYDVAGTIAQGDFVPQNPGMADLYPSCGIGSPSGSALLAMESLLLTRTSGRDI